MTPAFNPAEKHQSQIPAIQLLVGLGYKPLSAERLSELRDGRYRPVLLDEILAEQLLKINSFSYRGKDYNFDLEDAYEAIRRLKPTPDRIKGLKATNQEVYDTLILGTTLSKTIDGDAKSYSFRYVDWETPENNIFHVAAEVSVERTGSTKTKRCDIVGYVNGIPFFVIENKRPTQSLKKADSQLIGYQSEENIPHLFHFVQMLLVMKRNEARFATVGTPRKFWQVWREKDIHDSFVTAEKTEIQTEELLEALPDMLSEQDEPDSEIRLSTLVNRPLETREEQAVFSGELKDGRNYFSKLLAEGQREVSEQDKIIYALCRPERLLDMVRRFTVFDGGVRKIARHQQYFGIREAMATVSQKNTDGSRKTVRRTWSGFWHSEGN